MPLGSARRGLPAEAVQAAAALAAAMGIGRFVYTPLLPLMQEQAGASHTVTAWLATVNYIGYFVGAVALTLRPRWAHRRAIFRGALVALLVSEVAMAQVNLTLWMAMRLIAGLASAAVFVGAATAITHARSSGTGYAGVGLGIALSGLVVAGLEDLIAWDALWLVSAAIALVLTVIAWPMMLAPLPDASRDASRTPGTRPTRRRPHRTWVLIFGSYFLEGVGYIILGTFLVAAISAGGARWSGPVAWIVVGAAAAASPALCALGRRRHPAGRLLVIALLLQVVAAVLPALVGGLGPAIVSALLFGGTFIAAVMLSMEAGALLGMPHAAAVLTAGYAFGQILGPLVVTPLLAGGYRAPFLVAGAILLAAAALAAPLRRTG